MFKLRRGQASITEVMILTLIIVSLASLGVYYVRSISETMKSAPKVKVDFVLSADIKEKAIIEESVEEPKLVIYIHNPYGIEIEKYQIRVKIPDELAGYPLYITSNSTANFTYEYSNLEVGSDYSKCNGYVWISVNLPAYSTVNVNITKNLTNSNAVDGKSVFDLYEDFTTNYNQFSTIYFGTPTNQQQTISNGILTLSYQASNPNSGIYLKSNSYFIPNDYYNYILEAYAQKNYDANFFILTDPNLLGNYFWLHKDQSVTRFGKNSGDSLIFFNLESPSIVTTSFSISREAAKSDIKYKYIYLNSAELIGQTYNDPYYYVLVGIGNSDPTGITKTLQLEWIRMRKYSKDIETTITKEVTTTQKTYYNVLTLQIKNTGDQTIYLDGFTIIVRDETGKIVLGPITYEDFSSYNITTYPKGITKILPGENMYIFIPIENLSLEEGQVIVMYGELEKTVYLTK